MVTEPTLRSVVVRSAPTAVWDSAREWVTGLIREFDVIASDHDLQSVPQRLTAFVADASERFGRFSGGNEVLDEALATGEEQVDVHLALPEAAKDAALDLRRLLDEAVDLCRSGALLTPAPPSDVLRFIRWYLDELAAQIGGAEPVPWPEAATGSAE